MRPKGPITFSSQFVVAAVWERSPVWEQLVIASDRATSDPRRENVEPVARRLRRPALAPLRGSGAAGSAADAASPDGAAASVCGTYRPGPGLASAESGSSRVSGSAVGAISGSGCDGVDCSGSSPSGLCTGGGLCSARSRLTSLEPCAKVSSRMTAGLVTHRFYPVRLAHSTHLVAPEWRNRSTGGKLCRLCGPTLTGKN